LASEKVLLIDRDEPAQRQAPVLMLITCNRLVPPKLGRRHSRSTFNVDYPPVRDALVKKVLCTTVVYVKFQVQTPWIGNSMPAQIILFGNAVNGSP